MTVLSSASPQWPHGESGKVLLHLLVNCNVDALFEDFFGSYPELQAKLHKQRNDTNCAESPWVERRADLPGQQYMWPAPPAGADPGTPGRGNCRKVRFEAAPSIASKAFSSEEVQVIQAYAPGSHYLVQAEVYTSAMYGDQFIIMSRTSLVARGAGQTQLHIAYAVDFKPSLSKFMKPMVAKGVDGGIRGTFGVLKKLLQEQYTLRDLPEAAPAPEMPGEAAPVAAAAPAAAAVVLEPSAVPAPAAAAASPPLFQLADYIVYQELVAGIVRVSDPNMVAKGLAMCMTLALIHVIITLLRPILQACSSVTAAAAASGKNAGLSGLLCWPLVAVLDIPDNIMEVLSALLLVAVANRLLLLGTEAAAAWMSAHAAAPVAQQLPAVEAAMANGDVTAADAAGEPAQSAAAGRASSSVRRTAAAQPSSGSAPVDIPRRSTSGSPAAAAASSGTPSSGDLMQSLGNVMTGWGRNLLGASVVDSIFSGGSWPRSGSATAVAAEPVEGKPASDNSRPEPGTAAGTAIGPTSPTPTAESSSTTPARAFSHRHSTSFTAVMDPSGLNIIEDYAQQPELLPPLAEEQQQQQQHEHTPTSTAAAKRTASNSNTSLAAAAAGSNSSASSAGSSRNASPTKVTGSSSTSRLAVAANASTPPAAAPAAPVGIQAGKPAARKEAVDAAAEGAGRQGSPRQPLLSAAEEQIEQAKQEGDKPAAATRATGNSLGNTPPASSMRSTTPPPSSARSPACSQSATKSVAFSSSSSRSPHSPEKAASSFSVGSAGSKEVTLARRSASPAVWGNDSSRDAGWGAGSRPGSSTKLRAQSGEPVEGLGSYEALASGSSSYVVPGEEDEDEVLVEVFEHERVQPFRGWGHTWPGHFLPSDKVGHWGNRSGAPGGAMSMLFDRVAPKLPVGWEWKDAEWQVDMAGAEAEGCDAEGWSYGMDFSWLTWPPAPQMGKSGLKSFVRRRRWVRTRMRLPPGSYDVQAPEQQQQLLAFQQQQQELRASSSGEGLMAGLGGFGLGNPDGSAAAAAAAAASAASAMMNRFMRAVADLPSPTSSSGGDALISPPAAAAHSASDSAMAAATGPPPAQELMAMTSAASSPGALPATAVGASAGWQEAAARGTSGGSSEDDDSSSVDSDTPPPRPRFSPLGEGLAEGPGLAVTARQQQLVVQQQQPEAAKAGTDSASALQPPVEGTAAAAGSGQGSGAAAVVSPAVVSTDTGGDDLELSKPINEAGPAAGTDMPPASSSLQAEPGSEDTAAVGQAEPGSEHTAADEPHAAADGDVVADLTGQATASTTWQDSSTSAAAPAAPAAAVLADLLQLGPTSSSNDSGWVWSSASAPAPAAAQEDNSPAVPLPAAAAAAQPPAAAADDDGESTEQAAVAKDESAQAGTTPPAAEPAVAKTAAGSSAQAAAGPPAAPAAVPAGTPISTLRKAGSGISSSGGPRGAGRGAALRGSRSSSGGGTRSGKGKLGAVSLRHSADGPLRTSSSGGVSPTAPASDGVSPASASGAVSPTAPASGGVSPASASGAVSPAYGIGDSSMAASSVVSSSATTSSGIRSGAGLGAVGTEAVEDAAGMCEGVGSVSPVAAGPIETHAVQQQGKDGPTAAEAEEAAEHPSEAIVTAGSAAAASSMEAAMAAADADMLIGPAATNGDSSACGRDPTVPPAAEAAAAAGVVAAGSDDTGPGSTAGDELGSGLDAAYTASGSSSRGTGATHLSLSKGHSSDEAQQAGSSADIASEQVGVEADDSAEGGDGAQEGSTAHDDVLATW